MILATYLMLCLPDEPYCRDWWRYETEAQCADVKHELEKAFPGIDLRCATRTVGLDG